MDISDKNKFIEQPPTLNVTQKAKRRRMRHEQKDYPHIASTCEPEENASHKEIIESYFREYSQREPDELQKFKPNVQFSRQYDYSPKVFRGWGILHKSLLVWFVITIMFTAVNLEPNM